MKQLKVLIDNIDANTGIKNNILPAVRRIELILESRFPDLDIDYYPSYFYFYFFNSDLLKVLKNLGKSH